VLDFELVVEVRHQKSLSSHVFEVVIVVGTNVLKLIVEHDALSLHVDSLCIEVVLLCHRVNEALQYEPLHSMHEIAVLRVD